MELQPQPNLPHTPKSSVNMAKSDCGQPCGDVKVVEGLIVVAEGRIWPCELCHRGVAAAVDTLMLVSAIRMASMVNILQCTI